MDHFRKQVLGIPFQNLTVILCFLFPIFLQVYPDVGMIWTLSVDSEPQYTLGKLIPHERDSQVNLIYQC